MKIKVEIHRIWIKLFWMDSFYFILLNPNLLSPINTLNCYLLMFKFPFSLFYMVNYWCRKNKLYFLTWFHIFNFINSCSQIIFNKKLKFLCQLHSGLLSCFLYPTLKSAFQDCFQKWSLVHSKQKSWTQIRSISNRI